MLTRPLQIKDLPSIIGCEAIRSFKKLFSQNISLLGLKGILLPIVHYIIHIYNINCVHICIYTIYICKIKHEIYYTYPYNPQN